MALNAARTLETANAVETLCRNVAAILADIDDVLEYNSDQAIDWAAGSTPAYIPEDAAGNIEGKNYSRQAVSNAIGSLDWVRKLLTNQSMTSSQGDHLGNLNILSSPRG